MADSKRFEDWFDKANADLTGAGILYEYDGGNDLVAFHCQQAIEKALKGWLLRENGELYNSHSLVYLCRQAIRDGAPLQNFLRDCAYVNQFYVETRYPGDTPLELDADETRECLEIAQAILDALMAKEG